MTARKPPDPREEVRISDVPGPTRPGAPAEEPVVSPDPRDVPPVNGESDRGRHANVEVESGPVDREERDDPLPEAP